MSRRLSIALLCVTALASHANAQTSSAPASPTRSDTVAVHRLPIDASKIQPGRFSYRLLITRDTVVSPIGDQESTISTLDYAGTPAFILVRGGQQGVTTTTDSLTIRRADLQPLHWIASQGVARVAAEFTSDTIFGAMTSPLGKQTIVLPNRGDVLVNVMSVDATLAALPLTATWRDSATMLVVDAGGTALTPVSLAVEGEEHITVPAGEFDCWIVGIETERASARFWVTKQGQVVARSEQPMPQLDGATLTRVLVQTDNAALLSASARLPH
ncbi:MAG: hypothetical protein ACJ796_23435 [Gemmatimonadaceae bacterium]